MFKMFLSSAFIFSLLLLGQKVNSFPYCGLGQGENVCTSNCFEPLVVRPQELPSITAQPSQVVCQTVESINALAPIGDLCSCGKTVVKPAVLPQVQCSSQQRSRSSSSSTSQTDTSQLSITTNGHENHSGLHLKYHHCGLPILPHAVHKIEKPADAVSLAIALKNAQHKHNAVDRHLHFGFKTLPAEITITKKIAFPEEKLHKLNGEILELKSHYAKTSVDEEALEDLQAEEEHEPEEIVYHPISLGSLGYAPTHTAAEQFVDVQAAETAASCAPGAAPTCGDGYVAGQAIIKEEPVFHPSCARGYHSSVHGPKSYSYSSSSSLSSSSSNKFNKHHSSVFFEKLG